MVSGFGFRVSGFGFRVSGFGFGVRDLGSRVQGFGFRVSGFGFRKFSLQGGGIQPKRTHWSSCSVGGTPELISANEYRAVINRNSR